MTDHFTLPALIRDVLEDTLFWTDPDCPFKATLYEGDPRVTLIVGENASGKSLLFRFIATVAQREHDLLPVTISIRERVGGGAEMGGLRRAFMFGDEAEQSTGATSTNVLNGGFHNAGREKPGILMLDEPEIGLSDGYAMAMGELIGGRVRARETAADFRGLIVVTHSRNLACGVQRGLMEVPTFVCMGDQPAPLRDWMAAPEVRSVTDLENLMRIAGDRRKLTYALMNRLKPS